MHGVGGEHAVAGDDQAETGRLRNIYNHSLEFNFNTCTCGRKHAGAPLSTGDVSSLSLSLARHGFPFGTAHAPESVSNSDRGWYLATAAQLFNSYVNENIFKWPIYEPRQVGWHSTRPGLLIRAGKG